ncbi:MAG: hypothetical protein LBP95_07990 [Deltaproteobacteria bacterium]|nr:hypothetical protein [Deltaproteobacteria bacterium]
MLITKRPQALVMTSQTKKNIKAGLLTIREAGMYFPASPGAAPRTRSSGRASPGDGTLTKR